MPDATTPTRQGARPPRPPADFRALLEPAQFDAVTATVLDNNQGMERDTAEQIIIEALAFIGVAATNPTVYIAPSRTVDEGWHALILHTALYADLCGTLGRFVHHFPERPDPSRHDDMVMEHTLALMREIGHEPDTGLWTHPLDMQVSVAAPCSHVPKPGGCSPIEPIKKPKPSGGRLLAGQGIPCPEEVASWTSGSIPTMPT